MTRDVDVFKVGDVVILVDSGGYTGADFHKHEVLVVIRADGDGIPKCRNTKGREGCVWDKRLVLKEIFESPLYEALS